MSKFFYADGTVEEHPADDSQAYWELHKPDYSPRAWIADIQSGDACTVHQFRFAQQPDGSWWECKPGVFDEHAALCRLTDELAEQKALVLKTARALRASVYAETDPCNGHQMLHELGDLGVAWYDDE